MALRSKSDLKPTRKLKLVSFNPNINSFDSHRIKVVMEDFDSSYPEDLSSLNPPPGPQVRNPSNLNKFYWIDMHKRKQQAKQYHPEQDQGAKKKARNFVCKVRDMHFVEMPNATYLETLIQKNAERADKKIQRHSVHKLNHKKSRLQYMKRTLSPLGQRSRSLHRSPSPQDNMNVQKFQKLHSLLQEYNLKPIRHLT